MKIFLRIIGYGGVGLVLLALALMPHPWAVNLTILGAGLIIIAIVETMIKY